MDFHTWKYVESGRRGQIKEETITELKKNERACDLRMIFEEEICSL